MLCELGGLKIAGDLNQKCAQIQLGLLAIEEFEARYQSGGNDEGCIGIMKGIPDNQAGAILHGRRKEIEIIA
jgi:hypothetical protein